jgi:hypothetical protein
VLATYVANRQYIYVADVFNLLSLYRTPFSLIPSAIIELDDLALLKEAKGLGSINSALLSDHKGGFALVKEEEVVGVWKDTPFEQGCLCTKEMFVLANGKKLAVYDFEEVKFYDGFTVADLVDVACVSEGDSFRVYLLDGSGKVVVVSVGEGEGGSVFIYILIILALVITVAAAKFMWFTPKQAMSTDMDDEASRQDRENVYRELKDMKEIDTIKEVK